MINKKNLDIFQKKINYKFKDISILKQSLTHPSYFIELTYFTLKKKFRVSEFPVTYSDKDDGADSKIPILKESIRYIFAILRIYFSSLKNKF